MQAGGSSGLKLNRPGCSELPGWPLANPRSRQPPASSGRLQRATQAQFTSQVIQPYSGVSSGPGALGEVTSEY